MRCSDVFPAPTALVDYERQECRDTDQRTFVSAGEEFDEAAVQGRIGANIRLRRQKVGLSQGALAERAGIHRTFLNQLENGHRGCTVTVLARLARELDTSTSVLVLDID
ncbi:XRE family transcriptional regulator [Mycobacteroides abscessus subsp. massiliense]|nr:XRE family transcriptional regulator [Mycobacteroides abscessus subsp. massiliense]